MDRCMPLSLKPGTSWDEVYTRACAVAPEAFEGDRILNLLGGEWQRIGRPGDHVTPVDGSRIPGPSRVGHDQAVAAVSLASDEHKAWGAVDLDERKARVKAAVDEMRRHRETLAILLVWEIGKPWRLACADVDRALDGADWYLGEIERQLNGRAPLHGPISNIASWNYPMSVQVHSELVQALAGNAVVDCRSLCCLGPAQSWATRSSAAPGSVRSPLSAGGPTAARPRPPWLIPASGISWSRRGSTPGVSGTSATGTAWRRI
jgi:hypothetical protein